MSRPDKPQAPDLESSTREKLLISWGPGETRMALLADDRVIELSLVRSGMVIGAVILGRIMGKVPGGNSLFVDIGQDKAGFLGNPPKVGAKRSEGQAVLVQVRSDAAHGKGATVGLEITFAGRWLAYTPTKPSIAVSRRLDDTERERLMAILGPLLHEDEGVSIRTAAAGCSETDLVAELAHLRSQWQSVLTAKAQARAPAILWSPDPVDRMLALHAKIDAVEVDHPTLYNALLPRLGASVTLNRAGFDDILDEAIDEATQPTLTLPDGGRIGIGAMAALTAIDVDSGGGSPAAANAQAVREIARQIRLRGLGGQMVVDFIPSAGKGGLSNLAAQLRRLVAQDPVNTAVLGTTPMGLVELTRERRGPSIPELCLTMGYETQPLTVGLRALRSLLAEAYHRPGRPLRLVVSPDVAQALNANPKALEETRQALGSAVTIRTDKARKRDDIMIEDAQQP